jgi:hypothetical protein
MFSSTKTLQQSPSSQAVRVPVRPHSKQAVRVPVRPKHKGVSSQFASNEMFMTSEQRAHSIVQPSNLGEQSPQQLALTDSTGNNVVIRSRPHPRSPYDGKMLPVYSPLGNSQQVNPVVLMSTEETNLVPLERADYRSHPENANAMLASQYSESAMSNTMSNMNALSSTQDSMNAMMNSDAMTSTLDAQPLMNAQSNMNAMASGNVIGSSSIEGKMIPVISPLGSSDINVIVRPRPKPQGSSQKTTILYYDPALATVDGQLYVPQIVYDENGTEVDLQALQASLNAEVFLEPPPIGQSVQEIDAPLQQLSREDVQRYVAEPPVQDQYIIIATVAVMALLVGALSARRMRSRNFLSSCIENEALEEEVAYDVATTTGDYSTFAGNSIFRGDLEKFDV